MESLQSSTPVLSIYQYLNETWSQNFGHHFRTIQYILVGYFVHCLVDHCSNKKWFNIPLTYTLPKKKWNFPKSYWISISSNGISANLWKSSEDVYSDHWVSWEDRLTLFDRVFCLLLSGAFPLVDMTWGHWPRSRVSIKMWKLKLCFFWGRVYG